MWRVRAARERWGNKGAMWVAWHLPRTVVMWCFVRVGAYATTGEYEQTVVTELPMMTALERWPV